MGKITDQRNLYTHLYYQYEGIYQKVAQRTGLPEIPYRILYALCQSDRKWSQIDICREWNYAKQSVNTAIAKLVQQGYVTLLPDKTAPRNRKNIVLTEQGEEFCGRWVRPVIAADTKAFAALSDEERELCISLRKKQYAVAAACLKDLLELPAEGGFDEQDD